VTLPLAAFHAHEILQVEGVTFVSRSWFHGWLVRDETSANPVVAVARLRSWCEVLLKLCEHR
jgi:hypothetical protein